jgi:hypothetical protein
MLSVSPRFGGNSCGRWLDSKRLGFMPSDDRFKRVKCKEIDTGEPLYSNRFNFCNMGRLNFLGLCHGVWAIGGKLMAFFGKRRTRPSRL